jgi:hypothetical protein
MRPFTKTTLNLMATSLATLGAAGSSLGARPADAAQPGQRLLNSPDDGITEGGNRPKRRSRRRWMGSDRMA